MCIGCFPVALGFLICADDASIKLVDARGFVVETGPAPPSVNLQQLHTLLGHTETDGTAPKPAAAPPGPPTAGRKMLEALYRLPGSVIAGRERGRPWVLLSQRERHASVED